MSLAIAHVRDYQVATDDRKARRLFLESGGSEKKLVSTSELVRRWSERRRIPAVRLRQILERIARRARFYPGTSDPHYRWWSNIRTPR
jgi:hypothetical protein